MISVTRLPTAPFALPPSASFCYHVLFAVVFKYAHEGKSCVKSTIMYRKFTQKRKKTVARRPAKEDIFEIGERKCVIGKSLREN